MKTLNTLAVVAILAPAAGIAGPDVYQPIESPAPVYEDRSLHQWFLGGSIGYLVDAEDEFYSLHFGRRLGRFAGFQQSVYLEVGLSNLENDGSEIDVEGILGVDPGTGFTGDADLEATFIPITLNYMLERNLFGNLGFYAGAGLGVAIVDVDGSFDDPILDINDSGNDTEISFYAQAFAGLNLGVTEWLDLFAGARYMFIDDYEVSTGGGDLQIDDADDVLLEVGGRISF